MQGLTRTPTYLRLRPARSGAIAADKRKAKATVDSRAFMVWKSETDKSSLSVNHLDQVSDQYHCANRARFQEFWRTCRHDATKPYMPNVSQAGRVRQNS